MYIYTRSTSRCRCLFISATRQNLSFLHVYWFLYYCRILDGYMSHYRSLSASSLVYKALMFYVQDRRPLGLPRSQSYQHHLPPSASRRYPDTRGKPVLCPLYTVPRPRGFGCIYWTCEFRTSAMANMAVYHFRELESHEAVCVEPYAIPQQLIFLRLVRSAIGRRTL